MIYPEWVLKHKKKGTYVNCVKGRYYLYAAHSERIHGTKKVKRIFDGYLGRITDRMGLFLPKIRSLQIFWSMNLVFLASCLSFAKMSLLVFA